MARGGKVTMIEVAPLFKGLFRRLEGWKVIVELTSGLVLKGRLDWQDERTNIHLLDVEVLNAKAFPHVSTLGDALIRGSTICKIHLPPDGVDFTQIEQECRAFHDILRGRAKGYKKADVYEREFITFH